jgi:N-acetylmuramoyl-L-alanine amidase
MLVRRRLLKDVIKHTAWVFVLLCLFFLQVHAIQDVSFLKLTVEDFSDYCQVAFESELPLHPSIEKMGPDLLVRIQTEMSFRIRKDAFQSQYIESLGWSNQAGWYVFNIKTKLPEYSYISSTLSEPARFVIDIIPKVNRREKSADIPAIRLADKDGDADNRALPSSRSLLPSGQSLKTIVIDPGHGGLETGAKGKFGAEEKDITLDIGLRLKAIIEREEGLRVVLTRGDDVSKSLEDRAAIANNEQAYVFISIHANASFRKAARGSETYFLSLNATDEEARRLAYMENNSSELEQIESMNEDDLKMILWDMAQSAYLIQSSQLAELIQNQLNQLLGTLNRGIKQAPFKVLTGVACPAVLVEVAFISNPEEERKLLDEQFQRNVAQAIYRGLARFLRQYTQQ